MSQGDVVFIEVLGQPMLVLGSAEAAFDLLDRRSAIYSDRPQTAMMPLYVLFVPYIQYQLLLVRV